MSDGPTQISAECRSAEIDRVLDELIEFDQSIEQAELIAAAIARRRRVW